MHTVSLPDPIVKDVTNWVDYHTGYSMSPLMSMFVLLRGISLVNFMKDSHMPKRHHQKLQQQEITH